MSRYFVVGDIHGKAQMLEELMTEWDGKAQLVFLGDLIDRGENSKRSIEIVKDYVDHHGACLPFWESRVHVFSLVGQSRRAL